MRLRRACILGRLLPWTMICHFCCPWAWFGVFFVSWNGIWPICGLWNVIGTLAPRAHFGTGHLLRRGAGWSIWGQQIIGKLWESTGQKKFLRRWFLVHKKGLDACGHKNRRRRGSRKNEVNNQSGNYEFLLTKQKRFFDRLPRPGVEFKCLSIFCMSWMIINGRTNVLSNA